MTLQLTINLASFSPGAILASEFLQELSSRLSATFTEACGGNLVLQIEDATPESPAGDARASARELHELARRLNGNHLYLAQPRLDGPPVKCISVIFAEYYLPESAVLGVMFDRGFETGDDGNSATLYTGVPREACAIFVGAIQSLRVDPPSVADEVWFTTAHELGHLFNLHHTAEHNTYLSQSVFGRPFEWGEVDFSSEQRDWLSRCNVDPAVWPGGAPFGDGSPYGNHRRRSNVETRRGQDDLRLSISAEQSEFYSFEPIELDVCLKLSAKAHRAARIPRIIDPGYSEFRIWIESPDGQRRIYRSPRRYCRSRKLAILRAGQSFKRDISIFGESGGYTFRVPGVHKVWAEFDINRRITLRSNSIEFCVKAFRPSRAQFARARELFTAPGAAQLLYHRAEDLRGERLMSFLGLCNAHSRTPGVEAMQYALGRACIHEARRGNDRQRREGFVHTGEKMLRKAAARSGLGEHRIQRATTILDRLKSGARPGEALWQAC